MFFVNNLSSTGVSNAILNSFKIVNWDIFIELGCVSMFVHLALDELRGVFVVHFSPLLNHGV
jgi:hypothetical protein